MENLKLKGAVSVTLLALGGLAGAAVSSNGESSNPEQTAAVKPKVQTEVIRRTIHRTRMAKPAKVETAPVQSAPAAVASAPTPAPAPASSSYASAPVSTPSAGSAGNTEPPVTSSSGSGGSGGNYEADDDQRRQGEYHAESEHGGEDD